MSCDEDKPLHPALRALVIVVGVAFVGWAMAGYISELIGAYW